MKWLTGILVLLLFLGGSSCSRDPEVVKRKYVENGNKYFDRGKYKEASIMYRSALKKDLRYGEAYYRLGLTYLKLGQPVAAAGSLRRAVSLWTEEKRVGPEVDDARTRLADIYLGSYISDTGKQKVLRGEIKELADQLLQSDPNSFDGRRLEGFLAWLDDDPKEAIAKFQSANKVKPLDPDLILALSQVLESDNQLEESEKLAKALIEKEKSFGPIYDVLYNQYVRQRRLDDAEKVLVLKAENNPKEIEYLLQLARHYYRVDRLEDSERVLQRVLSKPEDFEQARLRVGDFYRMIREYDKAIQIYRSGLDSEGEDKLVFRKRVAEALSAQGKRDEASRLVDEILEDHPKDEQARAMRATLLLDSKDRGQLQTAVNELQASVTQMPRNAVVRFNLGRAYFAKGDLEQARTQFAEAVVLRPDYLPPRLWLGQIELLNGEYAKALQTANETLALSPRSLQASLVKALALRSMGNYDQARQELIGIVKENPDSIDAQFQLGILHVSQKNFKEAERTFLKCKDASATDTRCVIALSQTYSDQKMYDEALRVLNEAHQRLPERSELQLSIGNAAVVAEQYDLAIKTYEQLLAKQPNSADLEVRLGETYRRMGRLEPAVEHFRKAKELQPNDARAYVPLALLLEGMGRRSEARSLYEQVLKLQPDNPIVLNNLAYMIAEMGGDLDQALTYAQRAKQKLPRDLNVSDTLGWIYIKKNLSDNAIQIYKDLIAQSPKNPTFRYHLGMAFYQKGDKIQARRELEAALRNGPSKEEQGKIQELMARIG